jgi:hypothetical protein
VVRNRVTLGRDENVVLQYQPKKEDGRQRFIPKLLLQEQTIAMRFGRAAIFLKRVNK